MIELERGGLLCRAVPPCTLYTAGAESEQSQNVYRAYLTSNYLKYESHGEKCDAFGGCSAPPHCVWDKDKELEQKQSNQLQVIRDSFGKIIDI